MAFIINQAARNIKVTCPNNQCRTEETLLSHKNPKRFEVLSPMPFQTHTRIIQITCSKCKRRQLLTIDPPWDTRAIVDTATKKLQFTHNEHKNIIFTVRINRTDEELQQFIEQDQAAD